MQMGKFSFDDRSCTGCKACVMACRDKNNLTEKSECFRKVTAFEGGKWPDVWVRFSSETCRHCPEPDCMKACSNNAVIVHEETGIVSINHEKCRGCGSCQKVCPNDAIVMRNIQGSVKADKCNGCIDLLEEGCEPACTAACSMRALSFNR